MWLGTAFAYGQTSSGKTFTMNGSETDPGVIPQAVKDVFAKIETVDTTNMSCFESLPNVYYCNADVWFDQFDSQMSDREFLIRVSYMEIYNEEINDLLAVENQKLQIHESLEVG